MTTILMIGLFTVACIAMFLFIQLSERRDMKAAIREVRAMQNQRRPSPPRKQGECYCRVIPKRPENA